MSATALKQPPSKEFLQNELMSTYLAFAPLLLKHRSFEEVQKFPRALRDVDFALSDRMAHTLGMCYAHKRRLVFNENYFSLNPHLLPYTLFHELVHLFLFDLKKPWGHTKEFYALMEEFPHERYSVDTKVHIHMKAAAAGKKLKSSKDAEAKQQEALSQVLSRMFGDKPS
jgi:predicted SprT family Zn-dependent metalloprotease